MQIKCGQCGVVHELDRVVGMVSLRCAHCGHAMPISDMLVLSSEPEGPRDGLFADEGDGFAQQAKHALRERMMVVCAHCSAKIRVGKRLAGQVIRCTSCSGELRVPDITADDHVDISYLISPSDVVMGEDPHAKAGWRTRSHRRRPGRFSIGVPTLLKVLGGALAVALIASLLWRGAEKFDKDLGEEELTDGADPMYTDTPEGTFTPVTPPESPPTEVSEPRVTLTKAPDGSPFATGGYYPAPPGRLYFTLTVRLESGPAEALRLNPRQAVKLRLNGETFPCLGETIENALLPLRARQRTIELPPRHETTLQLLFALPARTASGFLEIDSVGRTVVALQAPLRTNASLAGRFVETPPRNLKALLNDPVMAAIQSAARQRLIIRKNGRLFDVRIPEAEVLGQAQPTGAGLYSVVLRHGPHSLAGTLRLLNDGERIVLYLRDAPLHQMTYRRQPAEAPAEDEPARTRRRKETDRPRFFGV